VDNQQAERQRDVPAIPMAEQVPMAAQGREMGRNQLPEVERGGYPARARDEKPPTFRGATGEDVDAWIEEYEQVANFNRWPDAEKRSSVVLYLQKTAKDWYHSRVRSAQWPEFRAQIIAGFRSPNYQAELRRQLRTRIQQDGESALSFCYSVDRLCTKVDTEMLDAERMQYMVDGLNPEMATMVLPFMGQRDYTCEDFFRQIRVQTDLSERKAASKRPVSGTEGAKLPEDNSKKRKKHVSEELEDLRQKIQELTNSRKDDRRSGRRVLEVPTAETSREVKMDGKNKEESRHDDRNMWVGRCFKCKEKGHLQANCPLREKDLQVYAGSSRNFKRDLN
jgi:Zinc knuckle